MLTIRRQIVAAVYAQVGHRDRAPQTRAPGLEGIAVGSVAHHSDTLVESDK